MTAIVACRQVIALLIEARRAETALLRSRGGSTPAMTAAAAVEGALAAVAGAAIGAGSAIAVFTGLDRRPDTGLATLAAASCVVVTVALVAVATATAVRRSTTQRGSRDHRGARKALVVVVLAAAALSIGQFLAYGGPLSVGADGGTRVDAITSLAPAAALAAGALVGMAAAAPLLRRLERRAAENPGIMPVVPARQLARRLSTFGVTIALTSLAVGFAILVSTVDATQASLDATSASVRSGADTRLDLAVQPTADVGVESTTAPLMGLGRRRCGGRVGARSGRPGPGRGLLPRVEPRHRGRRSRATGRRGHRPHGVGPVRRPARRADQARQARGHRHRERRPDHGDVKTTIWLVDSAGQIAVRPIGLARGPGPIRCSGPSRSRAMPAVGGCSRSTRMRPGSPATRRSACAGCPARPVRHRAPRRQEQRRHGGGPQAQAVTVVITSATAALVQAKTGDTFDLLLPESGFQGTVVVAGVVDTIPGVTAARGIAADLPTLVSYAVGSGASVPAPDSVWVVSARPDRVARAATAASVVRTTATKSSPGPAARIVSSALDTWWWAASAVIVFAALATAAMSASLSRRRRDELRYSARSASRPASRRGYA